MPDQVPRRVPERVLRRVSVVVGDGADAGGLGQACRQSAELGVAVEPLVRPTPAALAAAAAASDLLVVDPGADPDLLPAALASGVPVVATSAHHPLAAPGLLAAVTGRGDNTYTWAVRHGVVLLTAPPITIAYGPGPDQVGDLRLPSRRPGAGGGTSAPVAVLLHGGFWREAYRREPVELLAVDLTRRGFATWNVEYRRAGGAGGYPETLLDVAAAVDAVADLAAEHPLDPGRVVVVGHSAGGHLALWAAGRGRLGPDLPGAAPRVAVRCAVSLAGIPDLAAAARAGLGAGAVVEFLGGGPQDVPERYDRASPAALLPLGVPQVLVHGDADDLVPLSLARDYAAAAAAAGDDVRLHEVQGAGHADLVDPWSPGWEAARRELLRAVG